MRFEKGENHLILLFGVMLNVYLFFCRRLLGVELVTFLFPFIHSKPWPDCPDSGTPTAPLCRLDEEELRWVIRSEGAATFPSNQGGFHSRLGTEVPQRLPWARTKGPFVSMKDEGAFINLYCLVTERSVRSSAIVLIGKPDYPDKELLSTLISTDSKEV